MKIRNLILIFVLLGCGCGGDSEDKIIKKGIALIDLGRLEDAIVEFNRAIQLNPKSAYGYYNRAIIYDIKGQTEDAVSDYSKIIEMYPDTAFKSYNNRGSIYYSKYKNPEKAVSDYKNAIRVNPAYYLAYINLGNLYTETDKLDRAIEVFTKLIEIEPKNTIGYVGRYAAYFKNKSYDRCWQDVHTAESLGYKFQPETYKQLQDASGRKM